jgi:uncharacterized membrane protein YhaH (DUF805 family)
MESLSLFFSASGRTGPKAFVVGVIVVYLAGLGSQLLLAQPVVARGGIFPFAAAQAAIAWSWYALHAKRLRDGGRGTGTALAIVILYVLAMVLLILLMTVLMGPGTGGMRQDLGANVSGVLAIVALVAVLTAHSDLGLFFYPALAILIMIAAPMLLAFGFSIWAATRPGEANRAP